MDLKELASVLAQISDPVLIEQFLHELLTDSEKRNIILRWELMKALHQKIPQREIAQRFSISLCKITRGSKILKKEESAFRKILDYYIGGKK